MKKLLLMLALVFLGPTSSRAATITDSLDCSIYFDTVTLANIAGSRVDITLGKPLESGCVATPEGSVDGNVWVTVPIKRDNAGSNVYALTRTNTLAFPPYLAWTFRNSAKTHYDHFRLRITAFGGLPTFNMTTLTTVP
jgi:hypothetical protein